MDIVSAAKGHKFVFLGEEHATKPDQELEGQIIRALAAAGRHVVVGVEMYQRPMQDVLDDWSAGKLNEDEFLIKSDWKHQWGFDYSFYRPVFEAVRELKLPLIGLNVPSAWVHVVARQGFDALPVSARLQLPATLFLDNKDHREVFTSLMGGHSMAGTSMDRMYSAQVLWDESMADTAIKYLERVPEDDARVFVVIAGSGHSMYGQGINFRVRRRRAGDGPTVIMLPSDAPLELARGIGDFVFVSLAPHQAP
jgi:uncharacterized iron-regulated protein